MSIPGVPRFLKLALLSPLVLLFLAAARLLMVTNYDPSGAIALAAAGGLVGTLIGTVIPLLPPYIPVIALFFLLRRVWPVFWVSIGVTLLIAPAYVSLYDSYVVALGQLIDIWSYVDSYDLPGLWGKYPHAFAVGVIALAMGIWWGASNKQPELVDAIGTGLSRTIKGVVISVIAVALTVYTQVTYRVPFDLDKVSGVSRSVWLPAERLTLKSGDFRIGYTISTSDGWFLVLNEQSRNIEYLLADDVTGRRICSPASLESTVLPLITPRGAQLSGTVSCEAP